MKSSYICCACFFSKPTPVIVDGRNINQQDSTQKKLIESRIYELKHLKKQEEKILLEGMSPFAFIHPEEDPRSPLNPMRVR